MKNKILIPITLLFNLLFGQIEIDPENIDFGGQSVGTTSSTTLQVTSQIAQTVTLTGQSAPFTIAPESIVLGANESTNVTISFSPSATGNFSQTIDVAGNVFGSLSFDLTGEGTQVDIGLSTESLTFENCAVGDSVTQTVSISNTGVGNLTVSDIISSDGNFHARPRTLTVGSGSSSNVTCVFKPTTTGSKTTTFTISSNDQDEAQSTISGTGKGVTEISGNIGTTTLTVAGGPYQTDGHVTVGSSNVLTIAPGAELIFGGPDTLTVNGELIMEGTASDSIRISGLEEGSAIHIDNDSYEQVIDYVTMPQRVVTEFGTEDFSEMTSDDWDPWILDNNNNQSTLSLNDGALYARREGGGNNWFRVTLKKLRVTGPDPSIAFKIKNDFYNDYDYNEVYVDINYNHHSDERFYEWDVYDRDWYDVSYDLAPNIPVGALFNIEWYMGGYQDFKLWVDDLVLNDIEIVHANNPAIVSLSDQTPIKVSNSKLRDISGWSALETRGISSPITIMKHSSD